MLLDRPKEEIAADLVEQATRSWGPERAEALRAEIDKVAGWLSLISPLRLDPYLDDPDFNIAPAVREEDN